jgi:hypothetical protein
MTAAITMTTTTTAVRIFTFLVGIPDGSIRRFTAALRSFCYTGTCASDINIRVAVPLRAGRSSSVTRPIAVIGQGGDDKVAYFHLLHSQGWYRIPPPKSPSHRSLL